MSSRYTSDLLTRAYLEPSCISMMELLCKDSEQLYLQLSTIFAKTLHYILLTAF